MALPNWQLQTPIDAIIFDCDGTLSAIEGIDALASQNGVGGLVTALTQEAMSKSGLNPELYQKRLELVRPKQEQVKALTREYYEHRIPDLEQVIAAFKQLGKALYIISAGLAPAVQNFGELLGIPLNHIFAVKIQFDAQGNFLDFDHQSPLITPGGKRQIVSQIKDQHKGTAYIGDGLNDYAAYDLVSRFIGYGGAYYRENIAALCAYYIKIPSLAPLLPLVLTEGEAKTLLPPEQAIYQQGLQAIEESLVKIAS